MVRNPHGLEKALARRRHQGTLRQLSKKPAGSIDFSSNDFLSLASNAELRQDYLNELQSNPNLVNLGSGGSRLLDGNSSYAEQIEGDLADFYNAPAGLLCNSGFDANGSIFSCLPQPGDVIVYDELIHASVHDGMRMSRAGQCLAFAHNDVSALQDVLQRLCRDDADVRAGKKNVFVAVEAVYSMDGDAAPLVEMVRLLKNVLEAGNGCFIVDEAHSVGVFGPKGRGLVSQLGLEHEVAVRLHTFGKALACSGAVILCSSLVKEYLINYARPVIYTTFMPYPLLAAIRVTHNFLLEGRTQRLVRQLRHLTQLLRTRLLALEASLPRASSHLMRVPHVASESAISYVMSTRPKALAAHCQGAGFWVRAIMAPTVRAGTERVRICLHAGNSAEQVEGLVDRIRAWTRQQYGQASPEISKARL